ncbi:uncharacterized protein M421DRAFT_349034 [Didymella exigua CBS 183.55]|uniref:RanBP2-type domain-containing protein n=1 Tax=Didymella exigua CBS 183.55 TaxID=1150837 RepID=A0A6A5R3Z0_9PLEO|nr:uncharacterized protein M421DRAFT_349034 [Didymella exigua CBS 183.55]KAF1922795.1 hypothetical protein M421DRAFT_349034 [Didymella exigua CBS 183.55]
MQQAKMAAFSKSASIEVDVAPTHRHYLGLQHFHRDESPMSVCSMPAASVLDTAWFSRRASDGPSAYTVVGSSSSPVVADRHMDHHQSAAPSDGNTVWYCSSCNNGPMGTWYTACTSCGHHYCAYCTVEEVP